jgi:hypothetical protein
MTSALSFAPSISVGLKKKPGSKASRWLRTANDQPPAMG